MKINKTTYHIIKILVGLTAVLVLAAAVLPAGVAAWTSSTGISMSSGLTGWGGFPKGGSGGGGGMGFDPMAAAKAMLAGAWDDPDLKAALIAYAMTNSKNSYSDAPAAFMEFLESAYKSSGGEGSVESQAIEQIDDYVPLTSNQETNFETMLNEAYLAAETMSSEQSSTSASRASIKDWSLSVYGSTSDVYNYQLGLWYDASAGNIKYLNGDGTESELVSGDATGYMRGMVTSSSDVSACVEAFGADSWLSDELPYDSGGGD